MRELNTQALRFVKGGIDFPLFVGFGAGVMQLNFKGTMIFSTLFDGLIGSVLFAEKMGPGYMLLGFPFGACVGLGLGYLGYSVGNFFVKEA